jgi:hypothetical protein
MNTLDAKEFRSMQRKPLPGPYAAWSEVRDVEKSASLT